MEIKQIEVNGTAYDIALPGSDIPLNSVVYIVDSSGDTTADKLGGSQGTTYTKIENPEFFIKKVENSSGNGYIYSVAFAIPDTYVTD